MTAVLNAPTDTAAAEADLLAMAERIDTSGTIVTGTEPDAEALRRLRTEALNIGHHMTEIERLWVQYDPEYAAYAGALAKARRKSAERKARRKIVVVTLVPGWRVDPADADPRFEEKAEPVALALSKFRDDDSVIALARAGVVIACRK